MQKKRRKSASRRTGRWRNGGGRLGTFPLLKERRRQHAGYLSGGEQQMLAIGRALVSEPKVILLDEPSLGLAPLIVESIFGIIRRLKKERGQTVLLVEQNAALVLDLADHGYVMENGRIVLEGPAAGLRENPEIKEFYLGLNEVGARRSYRDARQHRRRRRVPARMKGAGCVEPHPRADQARHDTSSPRVEADCVNLSRRSVAVAYRFRQHPSRHAAPAG
jgi:ABC-type multidrug transport system ATPase subunit